MNWKGVYWVAYVIIVSVWEINSNLCIEIFIGLDRYNCLLLVIENVITELCMSTISVNGMCIGAWGDEAPEPGHMIMASECNYEQ